MVGCSFENGYHKEMCFKETGLHVQNMITILSSIVNIIGRTYMIVSMTQRIFASTINMTLIQAPKIMKKGTTFTNLDLLHHLTLIACFISYKKWV